MGPIVWEVPYQPDRRTDICGVSGRCFEMLYTSVAEKDEGIKINNSKKVYPILNVSDFKSQFQFYNDTIDVQVKISQLFVKNRAILTLGMFFFYRLAVVVCVFLMVITLSLQPIYFRSFYYCIVHSFLLSICSFSFGLKVEIVLMVARRPSAVFYQIFAVKKYSWTLPLNLFHQLLMMMRWNYFHHPYNRNDYEPI